jgi:2-hydroxychromene-2-carboxylate isomerase
MSLNSQIKSRVIAHIAGEPSLMRNRKAAERKRARRGTPHIVDYYHDVADPYSYLTAQVLEALITHYDIQLRPHLISGPPEWAAPARTSLDAYARSDAVRLARKSGLGFPEDPQAPDPDVVNEARRILGSALSGPNFIPTAVAAGEVVWEGMPAVGSPASNLHEILQDGDAHLAKQGHYLGATLFYGGEWYWGVDRLHYLEERLAALGLRRKGARETPFFSPPPLLAEPSTITSAKIEAFVSLRSPYTYLAFDRARELADRYGAELVIRPILPMVMRGLPVPRAKRMYILLDSAREARRMGIPFGRICDPLGKPIERAYGLISYAQDEGLLAEYFSSFLRGVWSEGIDAGTDNGLARIVTRAGLDWAKAKPLIGGKEWAAEVEANRQDLFDIGLWGPPSFGLGATKIWGQDRLWALEEAISLAK